MSPNTWLVLDIFFFIIQIIQLFYQHYVYWAAVFGGIKGYIIIKFKLSKWQMGLYTLRTIVDIVFYQGNYF